MANWASTSYRIEGSERELRKIFNVIEDFITGKNETYSSFCRMESSLTTDIHWCSQQFKRFRDISTFEIVQ